MRRTLEDSRHGEGKQAEHLLESLATPALPEGEFHAPLEHRTILAGIEPCWTRLEQALAEKRAAETTLLAKRAAVQRHEEELRITACLFKTCCAAWAWTRKRPACVRSCASCGVGGHGAVRDGTFGGHRARGGT